MMAHDGSYLLIVNVNPLNLPVMLLMRLLFRKRRISNMERYTLSVLVENNPGVLSKSCRLVFKTWI